MMTSIFKESSCWRQSPRKQKSAAAKVDVKMVKMEVDIPRGEGFRAYYITKIEELQLVVAEKSQNLRRLQVSKLELNYYWISVLIYSHLFPGST